LKSLVCISSIFLKFLSADQLEQIIVFSLNAASQSKDKDGEPSVAVILESISGEAVNHKKLVLQSTMNAYTFIAKNTDASGFDVMANRYYQQLLTPVIRRLP